MPKKYPSQTRSYTKPTYVHMCNKCQRVIYAYRNCDNEHHGNTKLCGGSVVFLKQAEINELPDNVMSDPFALAV